MHYLQVRQVLQRIVPILFISLFSFGFSIGANAASIEDTEFSDQATVNGQELQLTSLARLYYKVIFTGAVAGLYLKDRQDLNQILADVPKRLEFVYFGGLKAEDFVEAANESLAENLDPETLEQFKEPIDKFNSLYVDIKKNDRYAISYVPGGGLRLAHNGKVLGEVGDSAFANAYFSVWFGEEPFNKHLKTTLLAGNIQ